MPIQAARTLLSRYWDERLPIDPVVIADRLGAVVIPRSSESMGGASGMIELMSNDLPVISYNNNEAPVRQRFTIAHEIGHLALGHVSAERPFFRDTRQELGSSQWNPLERDANAFAANLLMPPKLVETAVLHRGITSITDLAHLFDVSEIAMNYRLQDLGLVKSRAFY